MPSRPPRTVSPPPADAEWQVALLRGVNVGGGKRVPMAALRTIAADIGFTGVATLLNSGNLVYLAAGVSPSLAARLLHGTIANTLQVDCTVFVRTRREFGAIVAENPFVAEAEAMPSRLLVTLWNENVTPAQLATFAEFAVNPERCVVGTHAVYLWLPNGISASPSYDKASRALGHHITARNMSTMQKLLALMPPEHTA